MTNPELNHQSPELAPKQEASLRLMNGTRAIIIFGRAGVGQSNLGQNIASCLGGVDLKDGGREIRAATGNTPGTTEFMPRDVTVDNDIDKAQIELIKQASPDRPVVIVAKLGGYNALKVMLEDQSIKVVRVLAICGRDEAIKRLTRRKHGEIAEDRRKLDIRLGDGEINSDEYAVELAGLFIRRADSTPERILRETQERERGDFEQWAKAYPEIAGIDIFNPGAQVLIGGKKQRLYDLEVTTTKRSPRQSADFLADKLVETGFAARVEPKIEPLPPSGDVFTT